MRFEKIEKKRRQTFLKQIAEYGGLHLMWNFWHDERSKFQDENDIEAENSLPERQRIEWKGTQKQLAELFIELEKNGWIEEKNVQVTKDCFTMSNSFQQPLKPNQDAKTKENTYSEIYTPYYKPAFADIKPNIKRKK
jgi:hypothetical protein